MGFQKKLGRWFYSLGPKKALDRNLHNEPIPRSISSNKVERDEASGTLAQPAEAYLLNLTDDLLLSLIDLLLPPITPLQAAYDFCQPLSQHSYHFISARLFSLRNVLYFSLVCRRLHSLSQNAIWFNR